MPYAKLFEYMTQTRWAINPILLKPAQNILRRAMEGVRLDKEEIDKITEAKTQKGSEQRTYTVTDNGTAIIPITGVVAKYANQVNGSSQPRGTSLEMLTDQFRQAMDDIFVNHIVLQIESPGGSIAGLFDFADEVYNASFNKPITAYIDDAACSAACLIASQANVTYANQTAQTACIGVYMMLLDSSKAAENEGLKFVIIRSGQHKGVGADGIKITDENITVLQANIDYDHQMFVGAVLRSRAVHGMTPEGLAAVADGRVLNVQEAITVKLIDGVMTLDDVLRLQSPQVRRDNSGTAAAVNQPYRKENAMTKEELKQKDPQLYDAVFGDGKAAGLADGKKEAATNFAAIVEACGDDCELACKSFAEGKSVMDAMKARNAKLAEQNKQLADKLAKGADSKPAADDKAKREFAASDKSDATKTAEQVKQEKEAESKPTDFMAAVTAYQADKKCTKAEAVRQCEQLYPKLHAELRGE
jgi:signal peptide peptidase SppA